MKSHCFILFYGGVVYLFWSSDANSWVIGKVSDAGKDWGQEKRASKDETAGWHHWCSGHELGQTSRDGEGQGGLARFSPWGCRVGRDWATEQQTATVCMYRPHLLMAHLAWTWTFMGTHGHVGCFHVFSYCEQRRECIVLNCSFVQIYA